MHATHLPMYVCENAWLRLYGLTVALLMDAGVHVCFPSYFFPSSSSSCSSINSIVMRVCVPWLDICICDGCEHAKVYVRNQIKRHYQYVLAFWSIFVLLYRCPIYFIISILGGIFSSKMLFHNLSFPQKSMSLSIRLRSYDFTKYAYTNPKSSHTNLNLFYCSFAFIGFCPYELDSIRANVCNIDINKPIRSPTN